MARAPGRDQQGDISEFEVKGRPFGGAITLRESMAVRGCGQSVMEIALVTAEEAAMLFSKGYYVMYKSMEQILRQGKAAGCPFWEVVLLDDFKERNVTRGESFATLAGMYRAMKEADAAYDGGLFSASGLSGGDGQKLEKAVREGRMLCGGLIGTVMEKAVKMGESNACMKRIVAAPTAGACGVLPAVFLALEAERKFPEEKMVEALYVSVGIGGVIAGRAFIAGASGGCQAEIGSAWAMAAGGAAYLMGGGGEEIVHAAAMAMKNLLGLACDPVAGLVEVPCVKRNVIGAVNALTSADMAMAGIKSKIPPDEVIDAMRSIGTAMPPCVRETGQGGLAATPTGVQIMQGLSEKM